MCADLKQRPHFPSSSLQPWLLLQQLQYIDIRCEKSNFGRVDRAGRPIVQVLWMQAGSPASSQGARRLFQSTTQACHPLHILSPGAIAVASTEAAGRRPARSTWACQERRTTSRGRATVCCVKKQQQELSALTIYMARTKELPGRPEQWNRKLFTFLFVQLSFNFHPLAIYSKDRSRQVKHPFVLLTCEQQHHRRR